MLLVCQKVSSIRAITILAALLACFALGARTIDPEQEAPNIIPALLDSLTFAAPALMDVRCGEWSPALDRELRKVLLERGVDVRETSLSLLEDNSAMLTPEQEPSNPVNSDLLLQELKLAQAELLELTLEQSVETFEKRSFISYARYKRPVNRFILKQISLPGQKLVAMREYKLTGDPEIENPGSLLAMKWYEPILAGAILSSLVYALWTIK
jgi:hypothetical protein